MQKTCIKCNERKPLDDFHRWKQNKDGHHSRCKQCVKTQQQEIYARPDVKAKRQALGKVWYSQNTDSVNQRSSDWARSNPEGWNAIIRKYRESSPHKVKANEQVRRAIRLGKMKRQPCEKCGTIKSHAHHEDYSKPLDVLWLCGTHHRERHEELKVLGRNPL